MAMTSPETAPESLPPGETFDGTGCKKPGCCTCDLPRCPVCSYTRHDAAHLMDHRLCTGVIPPDPAGPPPVSVPASKCDHPGQADEPWAWGWVRPDGAKSMCDRKGLADQRARECGVSAAFPLYRRPGQADAAVAEADLLRDALYQLWAWGADLFVFDRPGSNWLAHLNVAGRLLGQEPLPPLPAVGDCWDTIAADPALANARSKLSIHELRLVILHAKASMAAPAEPPEWFKKCVVPHRVSPEAALRATAPGETWQPIETAKQDGTWIIGRENEEVYRCRFENGQWREPTCNAVCEPDWWMPDIAPPTAAPSPPVDHAGGQGVASAQDDRKLVPHPDGGAYWRYPDGSHRSLSEQDVAELAQPRAPTPAAPAPGREDDDAKLIEFLAQCARFTDWAGGEGIHFKDEIGTCDPQDFVGDYLIENEPRGPIGDHIRKRLKIALARTPARTDGGVSDAEVETQELCLPGYGNAAWRDVVTERLRQVTVEGWTSEHDDPYIYGELSRAGACYAGHASAYQRVKSIVKLEAYRSTDARPGPYYGWPWSAKWWKPSDPRRDLVKAAALIIADIERLDRKTARAAETAGGAGETGA